MSKDGTYAVGAVGGDYGWLIEFGLEYLLFFAQFGTVVFGIVIVLGVIAGLSSRPRPDGLGHLMVRSLNDRIVAMRDALDGAILPAAVYRKQQKASRKERKLEDRARRKTAKRSDPGAARRRIFVLDFDGDPQASEVELLRHAITGVLQTAREGDEVCLRLESPGGMVHSYGLVASQLARVRAAGLQFTALVDRVAASGGYMAACVADRIVAAPFAVIGSIGVIAQIPNVHRLLKEHQIDIEVLTAGEFKRTLTVLGENTEQGRAKFVEELEAVHTLFKNHVASARPNVDIEAVSTGEAWHGTRALERGLVDELATSDEYLVAAVDDADIFEVSWEEQRSPMERLMERVGARAVRQVVRAGRRLLSADTPRY